MDKKKILFLLLTLLPFFFISAQNDKQAEKLVTDLLKKIENSTIKTDFELTLSDGNSFTEKQTGSFLLKKKKFCMLTEDIDVFFDGKTQWTYMEDVNEVTITEPTEEEQQEINPIAILGKYKESSTFGFSTTEHSKENYTLEMHPQNKEVDFKEIIVVINKSTKKPVSIRQSNIDNSYVFIEFKNFQEEIKVTNANFVFDKNKHKDVYENDLR